MRRRAADGAAGTRDIEEGKGGLQGFMDSAGGSWTFKIILSITALVALAMLTMSQSLQSGPSGASRGMQAATTQLIPPELGVNTSPKAPAKAEDEQMEGPGAREAVEAKEEAKEPGDSRVFNSVTDIDKVWVDEEENPFDKDWENFPPSELADHCGVSDLFYWNRLPDNDVDNPWTRLGPEQKYVTFEPDHGGWNNIRMAMEVVLVFAYATGRTLVMPPQQGMYLLNKGGSAKDNKLHFSDFFYLHRLEEKMKLMEMKEFLQREGLTGNLGAYPPKNSTDLQSRQLWKYLMDVSGGGQKWNPFKVCVVFPQQPGMPIEDHNDEQRKEMKRFCGKRKPTLYDEELQSRKVIHFGSGAEDTRVLAHFYTMEHFMDPELDKYIKRFVRNYIHYRDEVFCAAGRIIAAMEFAGGPSGFKSLHIRRGDLQFKEVKIPAEQIIENTKDVIPQGEVVYIATDEKDEAYLQVLRDFWKVRTLSDFHKRVGLDKLNQNYMGMVEQIVTSRSEVFVGTWFSTFTGYITRMRGYYGFDYRTNWYHYKLRKDSFQTEYHPRDPWYMREWPTGWVDID